jgi:hypothetical protein
VASQGDSASDRSDSKTAAASPDQARLASRKGSLSRNDNSDSSLPNPKSVINSDDELTRALKPSVDETRPRTSKPTVGETVGGSTAAPGDSQASDSAAKSAATSATKRRPKTQAQGDDADPSGTKKDDKKKGGFLRVFKKIFGHG